MARAHIFHDSGEAYDACQTDEAITNGDLLDIPAEGVVGLAWTWPVAVTAEPGHLHTVKDGEVFGLMADAGWTEEQVRNAVHIAKLRGLAIDPSFLAHVGSAQ